MRCLSRTHSINLWQFQFFSLIQNFNKKRFENSDHLSHRREKLWFKILTSQKYPQKMSKLCPFRTFPEAVLMNIPNAYKHNCIDIIASCVSTIVDWCCAKASNLILFSHISYWCYAATVVWSILLPFFTSAALPNYLNFLNEMQIKQWKWLATFQSFDIRTSNPHMLYLFQTHFEVFKCIHFLSRGFSE